MTRITAKILAEKSLAPSCSFCSALVHAVKPSGSATPSKPGSKHCLCVYCGCREELQAAMGPRPGQAEAAGPNGALAMEEEALEELQAQIIAAQQRELPGLCAGMLHTSLWFEAVC